MVEDAKEHELEEQETDAFEDANEETPNHDSPDAVQSSTSNRTSDTLEPPGGVEHDAGLDKAGITVTATNGIHINGVNEAPPVEPRSTNAILTSTSVDSNAKEMKAEQEDAHELSTTEISSAQINSELAHEADGQATQVFSPTPSEPENPLEQSQSQTTKKKLFGWLTRHPSNQDKGLKPPPIPARRDTASPMTTIIDDRESSAPQPGHHRPHRNSLRNRFKLVRMREEAGIDSLEGLEELKPESAGRTQSFSAGAMLSAPENDLKLGPLQRSSSTPVTPLAQPVLNDSLAPGTAAGASAGPSPDLQGPVDWDLWQEVVYEGPAAVARTSADELSQAIARGIPSAIRGVVWQVLAQSKNEDLEVMYRDLVARGTATERRMSDLKSRPFNLVRKDADNLNRRESAPATILGNKTTERVHSSASSIHSDTSSPPNSIANGITSSSQDGNNLEMLGRFQTDSVVDEKRKTKDQQALNKLEKAIRRDLGARTSYSKFLMSGNLQEGLFGICKAYALFDEDVGYAQGMNFIAMPLLFNMPEEEAFCLFVRLMNQYHLRDLFVQDMSGLHLHLFQFERLLEDLEPAVYCHLHRRGVAPQLYATQWFLTLFAYRFPLQLVLRIYDLILSQGLESAILKFGIVLMRKNAETLLSMKDMAELTTFLKESLFDVYIDKSPSQTSMLESGFFGSAGGIDKEVYRADALVQDACTIDITPELLKAYATEWEEKTKDEKEKQAAEDALRATNASLTMRVKSLEERVEKSDTEHVQMASGLVRTKVTNQQLVDENESLKVQVAELQTIIQAQPGEVEDRLRQEMDRIMKRNIEVQNENRSLEESCTEMEGELIKAKLLHAEANGELDSMKQKWASISAMMNAK